MGTKVLSEYKGTPFEETLSTAFEKLAYLLPNHVSLDFASVESTISFDVEPARGNERALAERFELLNKCIRDCQQVEINYYTASRDESNTRVVDPYHLRNMAGIWYLIGHCHLRGEVRVFALDRILSLRVLDKKFNRPDSFSIQEYLGDAWRIERGTEPVEVIIWFDSYQARWIREKVWHPSQVIEELADRSIIMKLKVGGLGEIKRWVMQFGSHAKVLSPAELCESIAADVKAMVALYSAPQDLPGQCVRS